MSFVQNITNGFDWLEKINWLALLEAVLVIAVGIVVSYLVRRITYKVSIRLMPQMIAHNLARAVYYTLVIIFVLSGISILGINLTGIIIAGGLLGIILGFALQNIVANLVSGIFLYWERPLKPGDFVQIGENIGTVEDISIMSTKIRGLDGVLIRIPNNEVFTSVIKNIGLPVARRIEFQVGIAYHEDAEKAINIIRRVADKHPFVLAKPEPEIFVDSLGDSSVNIVVRVWVPSKWGLTYTVKRELLWMIKKAITDAGIEIPFPQNDVWFRSPLRIELKKDELK